MILVVYLIVIHNPGQDYTEFYLIDHNNDTTDYPINITRGSVEKVNVGIINQEHARTNYTVEVLKDNKHITQFNRTLDDKEEVEIPYYIDSTSMTGENQTIDFILYKGNTSSPYRTLNIKYNVI